MQTPRCAALAVVAVFVLSSGFSPAPAAAQAADAPSRWWVAGGLGGGGSEQADGSAAMLELVHQRGYHHFALRGVIMADIFDAAASTVGDLGALYGRTAAAGGIGHLAAAAGVAYTVVEGCDEQDGCEILGVPLVAELALTPLEVISVGAQLFGNLNLKSLFGGAVLFLQLGWMP